MAPGQGTPRASPLAERRVILGVSGGIAAYKAAELARRLQERGARVVTILTAGAARFVTPLTFAALTHEPVYTADDLWTPRRGVEHVRLADEADLVIVAPATAHLLGQLAAGMAGDLLTTVILATGLRVPVLLAPAMNSHMWAHPAVQANVARLRAWGYRVMDPEHGPLAEGYAGVGRMPEPAAIVARADADFPRHRGFGGQVELRLAGHEFQRSEEAGRVAAGEKLFRIGARTAGTAEFFRGGKRDGKDTVGGLRAAFAAAGGGGLGRVEDVHGVGCPDRRAGNPTAIAPSR